MAKQIESRLRAHEGALRQQWSSSDTINHFLVDDLLPRDWAQQIRTAFPHHGAMTLKKSLREYKYVAAQMDKYDPLLAEIVYAFQEPQVVELVQAITQLRALEPDSLLYAGGVSMMGSGHFLNPHIDNSHDKFRERYRALNLLYYVSPGWELEKGGNLELWPDGPTKSPKTIVSKFNRLAVMVTHEGSWHSVSRIKAKEQRCCVSNYYFSAHPIGDREYFHVTSFRGRPEQPVRDLVLRADIRARMYVRKLFPKGIRENPHYYQQ